MARGLKFLFGKKFLTVFDELFPIEKKFKKKNFGKNFSKIFQKITKVCKNFFVRQKPTVFTKKKIRTIFWQKNSEGLAKNTPFEKKKLKKKLF